MAGSGVNVKMGVSGVAQFKQGINTAKQQIKTMNADLALIEKQFKASGDAEEYMGKKTELLKAKMEEQKIVLSQAEEALQKLKDSGVTAASSAFQEMQRQVIAAKGDLLDTEQQLQGIGSAGEDATDGVEGMNRELKKIGDGVSYDNVTNALGKISDGMEKVMRKAWDVGKAITREVLGAGSWADDLHTRAKYYELSDEEMQRMEKTATIIDTPVEAIINAQKKLKKGLGEAKDETLGAFAAILGKGYDPRAKGWENAFWDAGKALMEYSDAEKREVYAQRLYGRSWNELIPLFEAGREKYEELKDSWSVVPQEQIDALGEMDDQYQHLNAEFETLKNTFMGDLAPAVKGVMSTITELLGKFNEYLQTENGKEMMQALSDAVSSLFEDIANIDPDQVMNTITGIIEDLKNALQWVSEHKNGFVTAVEGFVAAWALVKTAEGITTVLKLIDGIKGLTAGSAGSAGAAAGGSWASAFAAAALKAVPWLAGLVTLLTPSGTSDKLGNGDLVNEKGEITEEAKKSGLKITEEGKLIRDWNLVDPNFVDKDYLNQQKAQQFEEKMTTPTAGITQKQREAAEAFWDVYRENPTDFSDEAWDAFESAFEGQEEIFNHLNDMMDYFTQTHEDDEWRNIEDLPEYFYSDVSRPIGDAASDISDAASSMSKLPRETAAAVRSVVGGMTVVLDGGGISAVVGQVLAGGVMNG